MRLLAGVHVVVIGEHNFGGRAGMQLPNPPGIRHFQLAYLVISLANGYIKILTRSRSFRAFGHRHMASSFRLWLLCL